MDGKNLTLPASIIPTELKLSADNLTPDEKRCLEESNVWNNKRGKCKSCKGCPDGKGRNFTASDELTRKVNGDLRCPPCTECPQGFYNDRRSVKCSPCLTICSNRNRHLQTECTRLHDATCGTCLPGFIDKYGNTDIPCLEIKDNERMSPQPTQEVPRLEPVLERRDKNITKKILTPDKASALSKVPPGTKLPLTVLISVLAVVVLALLIFFISKHMRSRRRAKRGYTRTNTAHCSNARNLTEDEDIEMDVFPVEPRQDQDAMPAIHRPNHRIGKKCFCQHIPLCDCCNLINTGPNRLLGRDDPVFRIVATNICHDSTSLFQGLGIPCPNIYQIDNDRDRAPEIISESEIVLQLLQKWVEITPDTATLRKLCTELCKAGFHQITQKLTESLQSVRT